MSVLQALAILDEVRRDSSALPPATWDDAFEAQDEMERAGLSRELWELQCATRDPPDLLMYEFYRWGFDEWQPGPDDLKAFVAACRRLVTGS